MNTLKYNIHSKYLEALRGALRQYYNRINDLEDSKYDFEYIVKRKDIEVHTYTKQDKKFDRN